MAEPLTSAPVQRGWTTWHAAVRIGILYLAARAVTTGFFVAAAALSGPASRFGADATVGSLAMGWDAWWYGIVATAGYPTELPLTDGGLVAENQWAFLPVYPFLASGLTLVLGSWPVAAVTISLLAGYGAAFVLYRMLRLRLDRGTATWAVLFFSAGPLAGLFQIAYAESLFLFLLFLALYLVMRRRFGWLYVLVPVMGFARPGVLAFSLFLALYGIHRWFRRRADPLPRRQIVHIVAVGLLAAVVGFAWQGIAALTTGVPSAYLDTELAWRRNWLSDPSSVFVPFDGFLIAAEVWPAQWGWPAPLGYVVLALLVLGLAAALLLLPQMRRLGVEIRLWSASYLLYLLAVFFPQSSIFRLLVPISPLWGAFAVPRSIVWRLGVLVAGLAGQWWWIYNMYGLAAAPWQVP